MPLFMPTLADIEAAAARIAGEAVVTPVIESADLNRRTGGRVLVKAENLQRTGSFKFRGAYNRLVQLSAAERKAGVVAWSSGNHAQGVAAAAAILGVPAVIVMPSDAPRIKVMNTRDYGADVVFYDRLTENRIEIATRIVEDRGGTLVPSYDDPHIITGQGTAGLELMQQAAARGLVPDVLLVCCSGGGLVGGVAAAARALAPGVAVYAVEPEGFDDMGRSLAGGVRVRNAAAAGSICDALLSPTPGDLTFPIAQSLLAGGLFVSDDEVRAAMRYAFTTLKLVVEPGGAVALAAALAGKLDLCGKTVGVVLSGGNVDDALFADILSAA